ncbi:hypothetical protein [Ralstonia mannitolilytica]|uniref:DUF7220 family protein n=1 Tax=Ralstonia mannitolilytica TaxID=105219 RepID=UPI0009EDF82D|nr:hypothetical protein [Ralstonia mannitolilytica]
MSQSRAGSLLESLTNVAIGYAVALLSQVVIFPLYDIHVPMSTNIAIGLWFTAVSITRSYVLRRWFNRRAAAALGESNA